MLSLNFDFNMMGICIGEKGQWLWALDAFAEDQNWVPSTYVQQLKTIFNSRSREDDRDGSDYYY